MDLNDFRPSCLRGFLANHRNAIKIYPQRPLRLCGELLRPDQVVSPPVSEVASAYSMETLLRPLRFERYMARSAR